jgi:hypothetical protein
MKLLTATVLAFTFSSGPAIACEFGKTAEVQNPVQTAMVQTDQPQHTMSAYDPATKPVFEQSVEAIDPKAAPATDKLNE